MVSFGMRIFDHQIFDEKASCKKMLFETKQNLIPLKIILIRSLFHKVLDLLMKLVFINSY